ncbi:hydantoinase/carbamoylase family amidase [Kaistia adipata]|uniref:hydantoinase/carbamoylase family amidase n=1 Tax=Kaistia adipata TaxID=166954 RepID=UPI00041C5F05|nr:hydantoinase/carbamoylase family amidase [Kaistia adipata]
MTELAAPIQRLDAHVSRDRLWSRHMALAHHGAFGETGVNRQALSAEDIAARAELVRWGREIGLEPAVDPIANLFLRLPGREPELPPVLIGSHIDSQPTGGRFDGAFGVLAALEALEAMVEAGIRPRRSVELVAWTNEEGSRFAPGMMGSAAFSGARALADIVALKDPDGVRVAEALDAVAAAEAELPRRPLGFAVAAYVEPHIEQGPILEAAGIPIGIVSGIQGKRTFRVEIDGAEAHAGTAPHSGRRDALMTAVDTLAALRTTLHDDDDVTRFTVGRFTVSPNAPSVVPGRVVFSIDLRHPDAATLQRLGDAVAPTCRAAAGSCQVGVTELLHDQPLEFSAGLRAVMRTLAGELELSRQDIASGAGHDARHLAPLCPAGMIFIPCRGGVSHNEAEYAAPDDLHAGARLLAATALWFAEASDDELKEMCR